MLRFSVRALVCACATFFTASAAFAQTKILNAPDTQVIDTTIRNGSYAAVNQNGATLLTRSSTVPEWERRTLINIDTTTIPSGSTIQSAVLTLTVKSGLGTAGATRPVAVRRVQSAFVETQATWLNRQSGTPWSAAGSDVAEVVTSKNVTNTAGAKINFDVTALVQQTVNGAYARQFRVALVDTGGGGDAKESYREYHSSEASSGNRPQLAVTYGSTTTPPPTTIDVPPPPLGDLQQALNDIPRGGTIRLAEKGLYVGNFRLPAKAGTGWVTITTNTTNMPRPGERINPAYRGLVATIKSPNGGNALSTAASPAASYYKIIGVNFDANVGGAGDIIALGRDAQTTYDEVPHDIELDRVLITGDPAVGQRRAIALNARNVTIVNCHIHDIKAVGEDSQAIAGWNTPGQIVIRNNYLEAAGENILFGGAHINIPGLIPTGIVVEGNYLTKDREWRGMSWTVKNLFELKNARGVWVRNNTMAYNWSGAQAGFAVVLTPRNSSGRTPWVVVQDVHFTGNIIRSSSSVFNILGHDDTAHSEQLSDLEIRDNLAYDIHSGNWGGTGTFAQIGGEPKNITIDHNTVLHTGQAVLFYSGSYIDSNGKKVAGGPVTGFRFTNNMAKHNAYGIFGSGQSMGTVSLQYYAPGYVVRRNVLASDTSVASRYPPDNFFPTLAVFTAGFVDPTNRNYELVAASPFVGAGTDGGDIGAVSGSALGDGTSP